jgi:uncharacterized protein (DUF58 family)
VKSKIDSKIRQKIRRIKVFTKRIMQNVLSGDYLSAFKGSGLEFDQIREYQMGDDVRFIDWNSSAKMNKIMIKQFVEERDRTVIIAVDVSASANYSSRNELRKEMTAQLAAILSFIAHENKDKVGILFFSDVVEKWIPPSRGNLHIGNIVEHIFSLNPDNKKTNIVEALKFLVSLKKRNAVVFMLSDWIDEYSDYTKLLKIASVEYDFICVRLLDRCEYKLPDIGLLDVKDPESGALFTIDTRKAKKEKNRSNQILALWAKQEKKLFEKCRIDFLDLIVGEPFINDLNMFFRQRIRRQI